MTATQRDCRSIYMYEMMACLGIEAGGGVVPRFGLAYTTAAHRCEACTSKRVCRDWLEDKPTAAFAPPFCPNADILFELQFDQPGVHIGCEDVSAERGHVARA